MGFSRRDPDSPRGFKGLVYNVVTSAKMVAQGVLVGAVGYLLLTNVPWSQIALPDVQWSLLPGKVADLTLPGKGHSAGAVTAAGEAQSWDDLTSKQHDAAEILGFDQGSWDSDAMVQIDRKSWDQLTAEEREAATTLSFDQRFWDRDVFVDIYERAWDELSLEQGEAAKQLGYKKKEWNNDRHVWSDDVRWRGLTDQQRKAAGTIGYTANEWDESRHIYDKDWFQLSDQQKDAAQILGYTEKKWNSNEKVWTDAKFWGQLNREERKAAKVLGFNDLDWDEATRAGSHSEDLSQTRQRQQRLRLKATSGCSVDGPFSFNKRSCDKERGQPYYVPGFMGESSLGFMSENNRKLKTFNWLTGK